MLKESNPNITNNLLANRRHWVKHFERLWFAHDYRGFMGVKQVFDQLLTQAKIGEESQLWACDLLNRTPVPGIEADISIEAQLSWLALATVGVNQPKAKAYDCFEQGAQQWQQWFDGLGDDIDENQLPLFQQVAGYLECYYQSLECWQQCLETSERARQVYSHYQAWQRVIQALKSQAFYHHQLGQSQLALAAENQIIDDIDYEKAPQGFKSQQMMDVLFARMGRKDNENAQQLLDLMLEQEDAAQLKQMLDNVQGELDKQKQVESCE